MCTDAYTYFARAIDGIIKLIFFSCPAASMCMSIVLLPAPIGKLITGTEPSFIDSSIRLTASS